MAKLLVGGEDDGFPAEAALIDDSVEDVGCGVGVVEVANFVNHKDMRLQMCRGRLTEGPSTYCGSQLINE